MKKALLVLALCLPLAALLANTWTTRMEPALTEMNQAVIASPIDQDLIYDESDPSGGWGLALSADGHKMAIKATPKSYPFKVKTAIYAPIVWSQNEGAWQDPGDLVFFGVNLQGYPGTELGRKQVTPYEQGNWNEFDVSSLNINITSGSFFFAIECIKDYGSLPGYPGTMLDFAKPVHHVSWAFTSFTSPDSNWDGWLPFDEFGLGGGTWPDDMSVGDSVDLMMRVRGDAPAIGIVELGPGGVIAVFPKLVASSGSISYTLPVAADVEISLWDVLGREVEVLYAGHDTPGEHTLALDGTSLARGTYFVRLKADNYLTTAKVVLVD